jgi:hypothetical protein
VQPLKNFSTFKEPEGSLPHSKETSNCLYPKPDQSSKYHPIITLQDPSSHYPPTYLPSGLFISGFPPITCMHSSSPPHLCHMSCPSHPPWLDQSDYTEQKVQVMQISSPFLPQSSVLCSQTPSVHVPPMSDTKLSSHSEPRAKLVLDN